MFKLTEAEMEMCLGIAECAVQGVVNCITKSRECDVADVDSEIRNQMLDYLRYCVQSGPLT